MLSLELGLTLIFKEVPGYHKLRVVLAMDENNIISLLADQIIHKRDVKRFSVREDIRCVLILGKIAVHGINVLKDEESGSEGG